MVPKMNIMWNRVKSLKKRNTHPRFRLALPNCIACMNCPNLHKESEYELRHSARFPERASVHMSISWCNVLCSAWVMWMKRWWTHSDSACFNKRNSRKTSLLTPVSQPTRLSLARWRHRHRHHRHLVRLHNNNCWWIWANLASNFDFKGSWLHTLLYRQCWLWCWNPPTGLTLG